MSCYCGSGQMFALCCEPVVTSKQQALSCEVLMRSRYTAYCLKQVDYLIATHFPLPAAEEAKQIAAFAESVHFTGLQILSESQQDNKGKVHFIASYLHGNNFCRLEEESDFICLEGKWYYTSGKLHPLADQKIGRNDLCPCGSSKKFKQCITHSVSGHQAQAASV